MKTHRLIGSACALAAMLLVLPSFAAEICLQDFGAGTEIKPSPGDRGGKVVEAAIAKGIARYGESSAKLSYDFKNTQGLLQVNAKIEFAPKGDTSGVKAGKLVAWIFGNDSLNIVIAEFQDAKGEWFSYSDRKRRIDWTSWRPVEFPLDKPDATWGYEGKDKGIFKWPLVKAQLGVGRQYNSEPLEGRAPRSVGTVYIGALNAELSPEEFPAGTKLFSLSSFIPSDNSWKPFTGNLGGAASFSFSKDPVRQGKDWSGKLSYDFRGTAPGDGIALGAGIRQRTEWSRPPYKFGKIGLWVYGDLSKQSLLVDLRDAKENHFVYSSVIDWLGWKHLIWNLGEPDSAFHDGKKLDGAGIAFPIDAASIQVSKRNGAALQAGTIYLSDFAASIEGPLEKEWWPLDEQIPAPQTARPAFPQQPKAHMEIVNGNRAFIVDGKPFIATGAKCDFHPPVRGKRAVGFFDSYKEAGATSVGIDIMWFCVEPWEDEYNFAYLDWFIRQAEANGLKLTLQLQLTNACGRSYPAPAYVLSNPQRFARMAPPPPNTPNDPVLCPNNPNLRERELKLARKLAEHLRDSDLNRTVMAIQINCETAGLLIEYTECEEGGWSCHCPVCEAKKKRLAKEGRLKETLSLIPAKYRTPMSESRAFTIMSYADEVRALSDEMAAVYGIPLYVNSALWPVDITAIFLATCPNISFAGADAVSTPNDRALYTIVSDYLLKRNVYFVVESPTESAWTREFMTDTTTFSVLRGGMGLWLWECYTYAIQDKTGMKAAFAEGVRPIGGAMSQIVETRGSPDQAGWYRICESKYNCKVAAKDSEIGNYLWNDPREPGDADVPFCYSRAQGVGLFMEPSRIVKTCLVDAAGGARLTDDAAFSLTAGGRNFKVASSNAGIIAKSGPAEFAIATGKADISFESDVKPVLEDGAWDGKRWIKSKDVELGNSGKTWSFRTEGGRCLRLSFGEPAPTPAPERKPAYLELDVLNNWAQVPGAEFDAIVSARALQDLPASSISVELPPGWTAKGPKSLSVPALKKGELFSGKVRYCVPADAKAGAVLPIEAKLYGDAGKLLAKTGQVLFTAASLPKGE